METKSKGYALYKSHMLSELRKGTVNKLTGLLSKQIRLITQDSDNQFVAILGVFSILVIYAAIYIKFSTDGGLVTMTKSTKYAILTSLIPSGIYVFCSFYVLYISYAINNILKMRKVPERFNYDISRELYTYYIKPLSVAKRKIMLDVVGVNSKRNIRVNDVIEFLGKIDNEYRPDHVTDSDDLANSLGVDTIDDQLPPIKY